MLSSVTRIVFVVMVKIVKNCPKLSKFSEIVQIVKNCPNCQKLPKLLNIEQIVKNCHKLSKLSKILKILKNCQHCQKFSNMSIRSCLLISQIKYLNGHKSLGSLWLLDSKVWLSEWLSDSVSEWQGHLLSCQTLVWTAKKRKYIFYRVSKKHISSCHHAWQGQTG